MKNDIVSSQTFNSVILKSTVPNIRLHDLRHSVASNLLNSGFTVVLVQVQEWLGHSAASTTLNVYSHIDKTSKNSIAEAIDDIVNIAYNYQIMAPLLELFGCGC